MNMNSRNIMVNAILLACTLGAATLGRSLGALSALMLSGLLGLVGALIILRLPESTGASRNVPPSG